jgi:hypothetical protein
MQFILNLSFANLQNSAVRFPSDNKTAALAKFFDLYFFKYVPGAYTSIANDT